jgi:hypothetical protein
VAQPAKKRDEVVPNNGDNADISGHEDLTRISPSQLVICMGEYKWLLESATPITVTEYEGYAPSKASKRPTPMTKRTTKTKTEPTVARQMGWRKSRGLSPAFLFL